MKKKTPPSARKAAAKASNVIRVPKPAKKSFNPHRLLEGNALLRNQVEHFKHLELKLPEKKRTGTDHEAIKTEAHAAEYIRKITTILVAKKPAEAKPALKSPAKKIAVKRFKAGGAS